MLGSLDAHQLGITYTHEHLLIDFRGAFQEPEEASLKSLAYAPVTIENLGWIRYNWSSNLDNLMLLDEGTAIEEANLYVRVGGKTIVDATSMGIGRDPLGLARIARATGLNIIMGSSYYVAKVHPSGMDEKSVEELAEEIIRDVTEGVGDTGIKAGIIGEVGCTWPWTDNERKVVHASALAQQHTGAPLLIHPGRDESAPLEIITFLEGVGADIGRTIMSHVDRTIYHWGSLKKLAETGCYLEYDLFGLETSYYPFVPLGYMPNDVQRMEQIERLIAEGYGDRVLLAHDIGFKHRLVRYGGHGLEHILRNIVPRMRLRGLTEEQINKMLVENPKRVLAFK